MFTAGKSIIDVDLNDDNQYVVPNNREVLTPDGWKQVSQLTITDRVSLDDDIFEELESVMHGDTETIIIVKEGA